MAKKTDTDSKPTRPNILLILSDEYRFPRYFGTPEYGMNEAMKHILGFQGDDDDIEGYAKYFPGLVSLRKNAVVLRNHTCLLYTSPSPRDKRQSRMPSSA